MPGYPRSSPGWRDPGRTLDWNGPCEHPDNERQVADGSEGRLARDEPRPEQDRADRHRTDSAEPESSPRPGRPPGLPLRTGRRFVHECGEVMVSDYREQEPPRSTLPAVVNAARNADDPSIGSTVTVAQVQEIRDEREDRREPRQAGRAQALGETGPTTDSEGGGHNHAVARNEREEELGTWIGDEPARRVDDWPRRTAA